LHFQTRADPAGQWIDCISTKSASKGIFMKTIGGLLWRVFVGLFLAIGFIVFTQLIGAGADQIGLPEWAIWYYAICLGVCLAILIGSKPAREFWKLMGLFLLAGLLLLAVGFQSFSGSAGGGEVGQMQSMAAGFASFLANVLMYVAPGGLAAFYIFAAYDGLPTKISQTSHNG
jgi:hypothetical protein